MGIFRTWALDVSDDRSGLVVHELDADLGDTTTRAYTIFGQVGAFFFRSWFLSVSFPCSSRNSRSWGRTGSAEDSGNLDELDGLLGGIHFCLVEEKTW